MEVVSETLSHGGKQGVYRHVSSATGTDMTFAVFLPPQASAGGKLPVLYYLSGLTCTHANVMEKGEYRAMAAKKGIVVVAPDTSPRGSDVPDDEAYDFGQGAGFYVDATEAPYAKHYRMRSYIEDELPTLLAVHFPIDPKRQSITGHSMGGHGALTIGLRNPDRFKSVSAFAPICSPLNCPWGEKALGRYLGADKKKWRSYDACALIEDGARLPALLIDQGDADTFLTEQLKPELLEKACKETKIKLNLRMQPGYDHSYYFISSFMADHIAWHASRL